jgi:hypothetical protein
VRFGRCLPILVAVVLLSACVTPAFDEGAYRQNATSALESAISVTTSADLAVQARIADRTTRPYADVVVTQSEQAIDPVESSFGGVDPPDPSLDELRTSVLDALGQAADALAEARLAVRRDDPDALAQAHDELTESVEQLTALRETVG